MGRQRNKWKLVDDIRFIETNDSCFARLYHGELYHDIPLEDEEALTLYPYIQHKGDEFFAPTCATSYQEDLNQDDRTVSNINIEFNDEGFVDYIFTLKEVGKDNELLRKSDYPERIVYFYYESKPILLHIDLFKMHGPDEIDLEEVLKLSKAKFEELMNSGEVKGKLEKNREKELINKIRKLETLIEVSSQKAKNN